MNPKLTLFALLATTSTQALAYETNDFPWNEYHPAWRVLTGMPSAYKDVLEDVEAQFDANPSYHDTTVIWDDENGWGIPNWESEIGWITNLQSVCPGAGGGCTKIWVTFDFFDAYISEADIVFDATQAWTLTKDTATHFSYTNGGSRPFLCTALHEMGHAMGLDHENDRYNIMGTDFTFVSTNSNTFECEIGADAMAGLTSMYSVETPGFDYGVSHWRYTGAGGNGNAYSVHARSRMLSGQFLGGVMQYTELPRGANGAYNVTAGSTVYAEFSLQNASTLFAVVPTRLVLSDNNLISTFDSDIGNANYSMSAGGVATVRMPVSIPATYKRSTPYFIGVIADANDLTPERLDNNNKVFIDRVNVQ
ncbi:MAG TPA: matrixin family metalloprotease [Myxococcota bacterium]|nr:matrixin family metalloprotease [Myxococcota bacterium]